MTTVLEIPICAADGTPSGECIRFEAPPPETWRLESGSVVELRRFRELTRFGCGCIWEDRLGYVRVERTRES